MEIWGRNKHVLTELARTALALRNATREPEREGMENLMVYLALELEKRARYNHYYDLEQKKHKHWWSRVALQFRIGEKVGHEMRTGRKNEKWVHERVDFWVKKAVSYHVYNKIPAEN